MERLKVHKIIPTKWFLSAGLVLLLAGMFFGVIGGLQYVMPGFLKTYLSFEKVRPLHVTSVVFWILLAAMGSVLHYTRAYTGKLFSMTLLRIQWIILAITILLILISYSLGQFGGREYWEFPPLLAVPILIGWLLFVINFTKSIHTFKKQPVYVWMWLTGAIGFLFIFSESYLWLMPYFQQDVVRDMTVQWKSYGSLVGCWNMLIYGSGIYLMEKISKDSSYGHSKMAFALYFLGLFNLFFNWSHHIYTLPVGNNIKHIGYLVSMTELLILGRIIYKWKESLTDAQKFSHIISYRFLLAADIWIFLNLILAILMSVPAVNIYTHGTHVTVAHVMGTTIGINTMLLMAFCFDILMEKNQRPVRFHRQITVGYFLANTSLLIFFVALVGAGIQRSQWQMSNEGILFSTMMKGLMPYFIVFTIAGFFIFVGFTLVIYPLLKHITLANPQHETSLNLLVRNNKLGGRKSTPRTLAKTLEIE